MENDERESNSQAMRRQKEEYVKRLVMFSYLYNLFILIAGTLSEGNICFEKRRFPSDKGPLAELSLGWNNC